MYNILQFSFNPLTMSGESCSDELKLHCQNEYVNFLFEIIFLFFFSLSSILCLQSYLFCSL